MAWKFRKRITIIPGVTVNLSKSGISSKVGPKGLNINTGKNGTYLNTGIPGTGVYDRIRLDNKDFDNNVVQNAKLKENKSSEDKRNITTKELTCPNCMNLCLSKGESIMECSKCNYKWKT